MINIKNLHFKYNNQEVFKNFNLKINDGEFIAILGHNGSGKSTLSKLLVGLEMPDSGEIYINNLESNEDNIDEIRKNISIVFQNPDNQFVGATVEDDIAFGLENRNIPREKMIPLVKKYISEMGLTGLETTPPHDLSGGQKQRTAIAGALAVGAKILILDESTSMLDPEGRADIMSVVKNLASDESRTIIMITHHLDEAVYADRIVVLNEGEKIYDTTPKEVFSQASDLEQIGLDVPFAIKASSILKEKGITPEIALTNEELSELLCR